MTKESELTMFERRMEVARKIRLGFKFDPDTELDRLTAIDTYNLDMNNPPDGFINFIFGLSPYEKLIFSRTVGIINRTLSTLSKSKGVGKSITINDVKKVPISELLRQGFINENTVKVFDQMFGIEREY